MINQFKVFYVVIFSLISLSKAGFAADSNNNNVPNGTGDFNSFSDLKLLSNSYARDILSARMVDSRVQLEAAIAANNVTAAERWRVLNAVSASEYNRVMAEEVMMRRHKSDIDIKAGLLNPLKEGRTDKSVFYALHYFTSYIIPTYILKEAMTIRLEELDVDNFIANDPVKSKLRKYEGGNMGKFLLFLEKNDLSMDPWSKAHVSVLEMMIAITTAVEEKIQKYQMYIDAIRKGTLNVWAAPTGNL